MKLIISIIIFFTIKGYSLFALTNCETATQDCPEGSVMAQSSLTICSDSLGIICAYGYTCDGTAFYWNFRGGNNINHSNLDSATKVWISNQTNTEIGISANNAPLSFQIVDIQTGIWVSNKITNPINIYPFNLDISQLEFGLYGIAVTNNNNPIQLLEFSK